MTEGRTEFTQDYIHNRLKLPAGFDDYAKFDSKTPGFGIRIRRGKHGETRTYFLQYKLNGTHRRITLGSARDLSCKAARALAEAERARYLQPAWVTASTPRYSASNRGISEAEAEGQINRRASRRLPSRAKGRSRAA